MSKPISESARKTMEAIAARLNMKPISETELDNLIEWAKVNNPPVEIPASNLVNALLELRLKRKLG